MRGEHLISSYNANINLNGTRPDPTRGNVKPYSSVFDSYFDGLEVSFQERPVSWGSARISYAWSHATDDVGEFFFSSPINNFNFGVDRSRSDDDQRHRVVFDAMLTSSIKPANQLTEHLTHGWRLGGILQYYSKLPFNIVTGGSTLQQTTQRPCAAGSGYSVVAPAGTTGTPVNPCTEGVAGRGDWTQRWDRLRLLRSERPAEPNVRPERADSPGGHGRGLQYAQSSERHDSERDLRHGPYPQERPPTRRSDKPPHWAIQEAFSLQHALFSKTEMGSCMAVHRLQGDPLCRSRPSTHRTKHEVSINARSGGGISYAGLFCIPFVLWLSVTGTIFLFHPQIQHWLDRPYDHLVIDQRATANAQTQAALAAVPGSTLDSYQLPYTATSAASGSG